MSDYQDGIFSNLPRSRRRLLDDDNTRSPFREALGMYQPEGPLPPRPSGKGGPSTNQSVALTPAQAYLARTVGGNEGGNAANITTLINGLVTDGVWPLLDCLYVLAQQNQADARLNLVGASYSLTGLATFAAYQGFSAFPTNGLDTGFNATTVGSPHYTQNSASFGLWSYAVISESVSQMGSGVRSHIYNDYTGGFIYARINNDTVGGLGSVITKGLFTADRPDAATASSYQNGIITVGCPQSFSSMTPDNSDFTIGAVIGPAIASDKSAPSGQILSEAHIGASLGAAGNLALYNRLRAYMTAVGVP